MKALQDYAMSWALTLYQWGGDDPGGIDCSGFVQEMLLAGGAHPDPGRDFTAQGLHDFFSRPGNHVGQGAEAGALAFYGSSRLVVTHVAWCRDQKKQWEAAGGDSSVKSGQDALKKNAFVKLRPIRFSKNLVGIYMPYYPACLV